MGSWIAVLLLMTGTAYFIGSCASDISGGGFVGFVVFAIVFLVVLVLSFPIFSFVVEVVRVVGGVLVYIGVERLKERWRRRRRWGKTIY